MTTADQVQGQGGRPVKAEAAVAPTGAAFFGRHDFQDLWTESVLGAGEVDTASVLRADDVDDSERLFTIVDRFITVNDQGVWITEDKDAAGVVCWSPNMHAPEDAGHWRSKPALPFPFTPGELAAFMLAGPGWWLGQAFGGLDLHAPDLSQLPVGRDLREAARRSERLLTLAWGAYQAAVQAVGPRPVDPADAMCQDDDAAGGVDRADGYAEGTAPGPAWSAVKERAWLGEMCRLLLDRSEAIAAAAELVTRETPPERRRRRLARLRELGGNFVPHGEGWRTTGNGALAELTKEEAEAGRPMADKTNIRDDLKAAVGEQRGS